VTVSARRSRPPDSRLVFALALVGSLALLVLALSWYSDHLQRASMMRPISGAKAAPRPTPTPTAVPTPVPTAAPEDLVALSSKDAKAQFAAVERLTRCAITPELEHAVRTCVPASPWVESKLACLRARLPGPEAIDWTVARLARHDPVWSSDVDECVCLLEALADRVEERPEPIAQAVFPFAMAYIARPRTPALRALSSARLTSVPPTIRRQIHDAWHEGLAVRAALALGMAHLEASTVEAWLVDSDPGQRRRSRSAVVDSDDPASVRLLVRVLCEHPEDADLVSRIREREQRHKDALPELGSVALDETAPQGSRQRALEVLAAVGSRKDLPFVEPLLRHSDPTLRAYAEASAAALAKR
jgi:hypothetical protein